MLVLNTVATDAYERLESYNANDTIQGLGGVDSIYGYGGDDLFYGGAGNDTLAGGPGNDIYRFAPAGIRYDEHFLRSLSADRCGHHRPVAVMTAAASPVRRAGRHRHDRLPADDAQGDRVDFRPSRSYRWQDRVRSTLVGRAGASAPRLNRGRLPMQDLSSRAAVLRGLIARLQGPAGTGEALREISESCDAARAAGLGSDAAAMETLDAATAGLDPILRESALAHVSGDLRRYVNILNMLDNVLDLAPLDGINQIYWSMQRQLFLIRMDMASVPEFLTGRLLPFYERFLRQISSRLGAVPAPRRAGRPDTGKVVIVTNQFLSDQHQPSRDLLLLAVRLQRDLGRTVLVLNTNMMPDRYYSPFVPPFAAAVEERLSGEQTMRFEDETVRTLSSTAPGIAAEKVNGFLTAVDAFDPDLVIAFGGSVVVADLLEGVRPLLCIPTTTGQTISLADIVLDFGGRVPPAGEGRLARSWRPFRFGLSLRRSGDTATRAEFSIPDAAFACIVVGNRLDAEVDGDFLELLDRILDAVPQALVLFAGGAEALPGRLSGRRHAARLRGLGHVDRMEALLQVCDLFLNPRRTGGGAGAAQALAAGLPVLSHAGGDVASVAGPTFLVADDGAFVARAAALAADPALLAAARDEARARFAVVEQEGSNLPQLAAYMAEAVALFRKPG
nr:glycosyltransferase [Azospirillum aestuarii]